MREFDIYYTSALLGIILIYIVLCNSTVIHPIQHKNRLITTKCYPLSYEDKYYNFMLSACTFILGILFIGYEVNYISKFHNENIYVRGVQFIFVIYVIILINLPDEYKTDMFIKITNAIRPLSFITYSIFFASITGVNKILNSE